MFFFALFALMNIAVNTAAAISATTNPTAFAANSVIDEPTIVDERREQHKKLFYEKLNNEINKIKNNDANGKGFYVVDREKATKIINYIKGNYGEKPDANFKHYVKEKKYNIEIEGEKEILYRTDDKHQKNLPFDGFLCRLQIDLVDMRHAPVEINGKKYQWICHVEDHFTKFHIIWALEHKNAAEVVAGLEERVLAYFGLPEILQSDNGLSIFNC